MTTSNNTNNVQLALIEALEQRISAEHEALDERLNLKDRWISDRFAEVDKRLLAVQGAIQAQFDGVVAGAEAAHTALQVADESTVKGFQMALDSLKELLLAHIDQADSRLAEYRENAARQGQIIIDGHMAMHATADRNIDEFKSSAQLRLDAIVKMIDEMRGASVLYVTRESFETQMEALEKTVDILEKTFIDKLETSFKQTNEAVTQRTQTNMDRITKLEQNIQVMNARNQQSIIALGVLLTVVEIIIRFYNN